MNLKNQMCEILFNYKRMITYKDLSLLSTYRSEESQYRLREREKLL